MKLCLVNAFFHPYIGGTEKHMYELGRRLARTHEVHVFTSRLPGTAAEDAVDGIHVWRTPAVLVRAPLVHPPPLVWAPGARRALSRLDAREHFDAFHLHGRWFPDFAAAVGFARATRRPAALTLHNARPRGVNAATDLLGTAFDRLYGIRVIEGADRVVAVCEFVRRDIAAYGVDPSKIEVIYNGVDTSVFRPLSPTLRDRLGGFDPILLYLGRVVPQKGLPFLLEALRGLVRDHPRLGLAIVGRGGALPRLRGMVRRWELERHVVFPGFLDEGLLPQVYASADLYVLPSLWEVLAISLLEASAAGLPAVVSDAGGNPEVVEHGVNGLVSPKGDAQALASAVRILVEDEPKRRAMATAARRIAVGRFDWDRIAGRTLGFYERLAASSSSGR